MLLETPYGSIQGIINQGTILYPVIQYAQANFQELPEKVDLKDNRPFLMRGSDAPLSQDNYNRYICPQNSDDAFNGYFGHDPLAMTQMTNQCHFLSIRKPLSGQHLPVMVWIHGGGYIGGGGDVISFDSTPLSEENQVIVVHVTYRLGLWGFLGDNAPVPANLGLYDVISALKWIQDFIVFFGGDPNNVTLFGQSAGGDLIAHLMAIKETEPLFHKVIIQSAPFGLRENKQAITQQLFTLLPEVSDQCSTTELLDIQRKMLKNAQGFGLQSGMPFGVQYGYQPMPPQNEIEQAWKERAKKVPVLVGYNTEETAVFIPGIEPLNRFSKWPIIGGLLHHLIVKQTSNTVYFKEAKTFQIGSINLEEKLIDIATLLAQKPMV